MALRQMTITESHLERFLTAGQPTVPRRGPCDLRQVAAEVLSLVNPSAEHRHVALRLECPREVDCQLWADADQLRELLLNLVINAVEAAGADGWARVELAGGDTALTIRVVDGGPGPERRLAERLFEPFATGKPEGIGLGLTVAKKIAESHGGTIRYVTDGPTCFEAMLPRAAELRPTPDRAPGAPVAAVLNP